MHINISPKRDLLCVHFYNTPKKKGDLLCKPTHLYAFSHLLSVTRKITRSSLNRIYKTLMIPTNATSDGPVYEFDLSIFHDTQSASAGSYPNS